MKRSGQIFGLLIVWLASAISTSSAGQSSKAKVEVPIRTCHMAKIRTEGGKEIWLVTGKEVVANIETKNQVLEFKNREKIDAAFACCKRWLEGKK